MNLKELLHSAFKAGNAYGRDNLNDNYYQWWTDNESKINDWMNLYGLSMDDDEDLDLRAELEWQKRKATWENGGISDLSSTTKLKISDL